MKNSKVFYRSALATAIVMALSAPAFATDSTVSTDPVTLNTEKTTLDQDVVINGDNKITAVTIETSDSDKDLNVTFGGHDITAASTVNQDFVEGVKVSGNKNVVINATDSTITAQGEGTYVRTAMVIDSTGDVVVNGGNFVAKNEKGSATGISLEATTGNNLTLNGTTINAQGNIIRVTATALRQFLLKRVICCRVLTVMQPTTSPLLTQILLMAGLKQ